MLGSLIVPSLIGATAILAHRRIAAGFQARTEALVAGLRSASAEEPVAPNLPGIVQDYIQRTMPGPSLAGIVRLHQRGAMRLKPGGPWRPLTAEQAMSVRTPGFVWRADIRMAPLLSARVVDAYVDGKGLLEARLLGSLPLARAVGPEIDRGELMRYLAELVWVPHAMQRNPHLRWRLTDKDTVEVSADSSGGPARVRLTFESGDVSRVEADDRPRQEGRHTVSRRWVGRLSDYGAFNGVRIPRRAEVAWMLEDGPFAYWRGEITAFEAR